MRLYKTECKDGFVIYKYECKSDEAKYMAYQCILDNIDFDCTEKHYTNDNCEIYTHYSKYTWSYNPYDYIELITYENKDGKSVFVDITDSMTKERFYYNVIDNK